MVVPALVKGLAVNPLYQYISYLYSYQGGIALRLMVFTLDQLFRLLSALVLFSAAAGLLFCLRRRSVRGILLPAGLYTILLAVDKVLAYVTTYGFTVLGKNNFTLSMLRSMNGELLRLSLQDITAGVVYIALFILLAFMTMRFSDKTQRIWITICYLVPQLGAAVYRVIVNIIQAAAPTTFFDWVILAGPFVRAFIFAAAGYFYLRGCHRLLDEKSTCKKTV